MKDDVMYKTVGARVPAEVYQRILDEANNSGMAVSEWLRLAIDTKLDAKAPKAVDALDALERAGEEINRLKVRLKTRIIKTPIRRDIKIPRQEG